MVEDKACIRYKKLNYLDENKMARPRRRWAKRMNIKVKGLRISGRGRLKLKALCVVFWPRKIAKIYADIVDRIMKIDGSCPGIIFSSQLGFPVLSYPTAECRRRKALSFNKKITSFSVSSEVVNL